MKSHLRFRQKYTHQQINAWFEEGWWRAENKAINEGEDRIFKKANHRWIKAYNKRYGKYGIKFMQ